MNVCLVLVYLLWPVTCSICLTAQSTWRMTPGYTVAFGFVSVHFWVPVQRPAICREVSVPSAVGGEFVLTIKQRGHFMRLVNNVDCVARRFHLTCSVLSTMTMVDIEVSLWVQPSGMSSVSVVERVTSLTWYSKGKSPNGFMIMEVYLTLVPARLGDPLEKRLACQQCDSWWASSTLRPDWFREAVDVRQLCELGPDCDLCVPSNWKPCPDRVMLQPRIVVLSPKKMFFVVQVKEPGRLTEGDKSTELGAEQW